MEAAAVRVRCCQQQGDVRYFPPQRERREAVEALVYEKAASARMREIALRSKLGGVLGQKRRNIRRLEQAGCRITVEVADQLLDYTLEVEAHH